MTPIDVLDEIISNLEPEDVPAEFIVMAKITGFDGVEKIIRGVELEEIIRNPDRHLHIAEARVILNVPKIRRAIVNEVNSIYDTVHREFNTAPHRNR